MLSKCLAQPGSGDKNHPVTANNPFPGRAKTRRYTTRLHQPSNEMQMPFFVRSRNNGKTFELRIKHGRLPKPVYHTFDVQEDAQRAGQRAIAALDRGEIPSWLERKERGALVTISQAIVTRCKEFTRRGEFVEDRTSTAESGLIYAIDVYPTGWWRGAASVVVCASSTSTVLQTGKCG